MRNHAIDFFRGIIAIQVVMIHTVFHSGATYVPESIQGLALLFDVPIFLIISGMTYSLHEGFGRKIKEILNIIYKWTIFVILCFVFLFIFDREHTFLRYIPSWIVFNPPAKDISKYVTILKSSLWFMTPFIQSSLICAGILYLINNFSDKDKRLKMIVMTLWLLVFLLLAANNGVSYFSLDAKAIAFSIFFLIGYLSMFYHFKDFKSFLLVETITIFCFYLIMHFNGYGIADMSLLKSKMSYMYVLYSLISIFLIIYLKDRFKYDKNVFKPINFVGKNALYLYFSQGISSSLLYFIVPKVTINNLYIKIIVMFIINLGMALIIFFSLLFVYKLIDLVSTKIKDKKEIYNMHILKRVR